MPWKEATNMSERTEFIREAQAGGINFSGLCRRYGISRKTGYKWLKRARDGGESGLVDRSRRPHLSPRQTADAVENIVLGVREKHPAWGGRKIRKVLQNRGHTQVPAASTITVILHRHDRLDPEESPKHKPMQRFEYEQPNALWQMDFKGHFPMSGGGHCHPLTIIDDHSRFLVGLRACPNEKSETVKAQLSMVFRQFGLPDRMLMDNGSPWGYDLEARHSLLTAWLIQLGIAISHGRPYHPQTQGKDERLNRSLKAEVIKGHTFSDLLQSQTTFDEWQHIYNYIRPHEALKLDTPSNHYTPSVRNFPEELPPVSYPDDDMIRKVDISGKIYFLGGTYRISAAFRRQSVAVRPTQQDGVFDVYFCAQKVAQINLRDDNLC
jgi:transposase InsO family protein